MTQSVEDMASPAKNRSGVEAGSPQTSSKNNYAAQKQPLPHEVELPPEFDGTSTPAAWVEDLRRRATQLLWTEKEYDRERHDCVAKWAAQQQRKPSNYALSSSALGPQHWAWLIALLLLLLVLWLSGV